MASVFLSYDHDDHARAAPIAAALEKAGHSVWWDQRIAAGAEYNAEIEGAVEHADAVVVLWSERSIRSAWVRDEAAEGRDQGKLVPATIDGAKPPMGFRQYQTIDLSKRKAGGGLQHLDELLRVIGNMAPTDGRAATAPSVRPAEHEQQGSRINWPLIVAFAVALTIGAALAAWRLLAPRSSVPVIAVVAAERSPAAESLARDILVKLGSLQSARTDAIRLVGSDKGADLIFEASGTNDPKLAQANLALLGGKDRSVLWSKDFEAQRGNRTALEQSMAYTAGQVLDCAVQASAASARLDEQTFKLFLNGCALYAERYFSDPSSVVPLFTRIVALAPTFQPAWAKLLMAEVQTARAKLLFYGRLDPGQLPGHIAAVAKLNPRLPELYVAKTGLFPIGALEQRFSLLDEAVRLGPDDPNPFSARSTHLVEIGRNNDAVDDARRAAELDPLSPGFESNLIQLLAYSGQMAAAEQELRRAEQLWPGTPAIEDARFRLTSRFGDPREALRMLHSAGFRQAYPTSEMEAYLLARIDPTDANIHRAIATAQNQLVESRSIAQVIQFLGDFGRDEELFNMLMRFNRAQLASADTVIFRPSMRKLRQDPRFMILAKRAGLIDFWRKTGKWPDFCFEPDLPYDCKKEAAKLNA